MQFSQTLADNVLTALVWHKKVASAILVQLGDYQERIFPNFLYQKVARAAINHILEYGEPPGVHILDIFDVELSKSGNSRDSLLLLLTSMRDHAPNVQPQFVMDNMERFIALSHIQIHLAKAMDFATKEDLDGVREVLAHRDMMPSFSQGTLLNDPDQSLRFMQNTFHESFSSGIHLLDERGIVPARKTLFLVMAPAKRGKTWWLIAIGRKSWYSRKKVLHITLEMSEDRIAQRYHQAGFLMARAASQDIENPIMEKDEKGRFATLAKEPHRFSALGFADTTIPEMSSRIKDRFSGQAPIYIKEFPTGSLTVAQLNAYLDMMNVQIGFIPDIILLDYADIMQIDSDSLRTDTGVLFRNLRRLAGERNMAIVTASQGNRASSTARTVGVTHVAEDWSKIGTADAILTYSQTSMERIFSLARIGATLREDESPGEILITQSYKTGQFCLDSVVLTKDIQDDLKARFNEEELNGDKPGSH
jgi:DnaB-like helicase C terminal domain